MCDGLLRMDDATDGITAAKIHVVLWATAHGFQPGHRVRVQVSSGAHPRWARNPGTGEPLAAAATLVAADQTVFHDPLRPSAIVLPVVR